MAEKLRISGFSKESIVDGRGLRYVIFCQGCPHACPNCHNAQTHDFSGGQEMTVDRIYEDIKKNPMLQGVTFSGGEPFCQPAAYARLGEKIKAARGNKLDITCFTGYTYEELLQMAKTNAAISDLLAVCDFLIDGRFMQAERDLTLKYRGSRNQRYIDMRRTRISGKVVPVSEATSARHRYAAYLR